MHWTDAEDDVFDADFDIALKCVQLPWLYLVVASQVPNYLTDAAVAEIKLWGTTLHIALLCDPADEGYILAAANKVELTTSKETASHLFWL